MTLQSYAKSIVAAAGNTLTSGDVFAKVLSPNDDSGRHGVLIPTDAYAFFPHIEIPDPRENETTKFEAFDAVALRWKTLTFKYYQRYPERRVTRLNPLINDLGKGLRLVVFIHATHPDRSSGYYVDHAFSGDGGRFQKVFRTIFGDTIASDPDNFIVRPIDSDAFVIDRNLAELLGKFDGVKAMGWIDAMRSGDTGIGYTFETLLGIKENNDQIADFKGIEIKCKGVKEGAAASSGKINLFQAGPTWNSKLSARERIRILGAAGADGRYSCYSQVTTNANNLGLLLQILRDDSRIDLRKRLDPLGYWSFERLEKRLAEKHSRAAFVKAEVRKAQAQVQYAYKELVYCEKPSIQRFVELVSQRNIVFEFLMSEQPDRVRITDIRGDSVVRSFSTTCLLFR